MKQLSVFLENKSGKLLQLTNLLKENNINIDAVTIAETQEFGIARMIIKEIDRATELLKSKGFACKQTDVIVVEVPDRPGGLSEILTLFDDAKINIEYMYGFLERQKDAATMVFRLKDNNLARELLTNNNCIILD